MAAESTQPTTEAQAPTVEDELPALEEQTAPAAEGTEGAAGEQKKASTRSEKKSRKALQKIGLKPYPGVVRVTLRQRGQNILIQDAEVFKGAGDTYVVFGQPVQEESQFNKAKQQQQLKELLKQAQSQQGLENQLKELGLGETKEGTKVEEVTEEAASAEGLTEKDIELVMKQGNVSRNEAIKTLRKNNGDIVQAIMDLSGVKSG